MNDLLKASGFKLSNVWYHGTSSLLVSSILEKGLKVSGDDELNSHVKSTMESMGLLYTPNKEPIYLTPSKEIAHYWAKQTVMARNSRLRDGNKGAVLKIVLPGDLNELVEPDIGGYKRVIDNKEEYFFVLQEIYKAKNIVLPSNIDYSNVIQFFGLAFISQVISSEYISQISAT
jgi:hypothetical protein